MSAPSTNPSATEFLFSYGTLQTAAVQMATFGRLLQGEPDALPGHASTTIAIDDPAVVATSGATHHPIVAFTGSPEDRVPGTLFRVTPQELADADQYEVAAYRRQEVALASGRMAWAYVKA